MKKHYLSGFLAILLSMFINPSQAQVSFLHSLGGAVYYSSNTSSYAIEYSPRLNFEMGDELSLSLGTHLGVGLAASANSQSGGSISFALDLPIVAELNFGHAAHRDADGGFGGFVGMGFGINKMGNANNFGSSYNNALGPVFNGGIRFRFMETRSLGLRVAYMLNVKDGGASVLGISFSYLLNKL